MQVKLKQNKIFDEAEEDNPKKNRHNKDSTREKTDDTAPKRQEKKSNQKQQSAAVTRGIFYFRIFPLLSSSPHNVLDCFSYSSANKEQDHL